MTPDISIIMPIYNGAKTLEATLNSLKGQNGAMLEIIAVDQASSDGSRDILRAYQAELPIHILDAPDSKNWMQNTNIGLAAAKAPLVTMLHQDDMWLPGRAVALCDLARAYPQAELWLHPAWFAGPNDDLVGSFGPAFGNKDRLVASADAVKALVVQNTVALPAAMFKRDTALQLGGLSEDLWYTADWDFWLKLASAGPIAWTPQKLAAFRVHENSQTVQGSKAIDDFRTQLTIPVERHIGSVGTPDAAAIRARADASNCLNLFLAARFHKHPTSILPFAKKFLALGPSGWVAFFRDTRIVARVLPRLRLLRQ